MGPGTPTREAPWISNFLPPVDQGQSLVLFILAESSFSHPLSHHLAFPGKDAFPCSREMSDVMLLVWRNQRNLWASLQPPPHPDSHLISLLRTDQEEFRKLSRGFFFWTSPIEPCQEKIISRARKLSICRRTKRCGVGEARGRESKCEGKGDSILSWS